jgi:hypothetical protein
MFTSRSEGGLGILNPSALYSAKHLSFKLSALNSDDAQVRETARASLALHMQKRKVPEVQDGDGGGFGGFQTTDDGNLAKASRVTWHRSDWVHLHEVCVRENVVLEKRSHDDNYALTFTVDENVTMTTTDSKAAYTMCKQQKQSHFTSEWKEKEWQGRIVREATQINYKLSTAFLNNVKIRDSLVSFVVRGRLQLLQCNSLMALYYPNECSRRCQLCNHPAETVSHILNGCKYQTLYQARHNRLVDVITSYVPNNNGARMIIKDTCLTPRLFGRDSDAFVTNAIRPDISIINHTNREVILVEVAVPFDAFIDICYSTKFDKYLPLCLEINSLGYACRTVVVIIGSLGNVHMKVVPGLRILGMPSYSAKWLAKYLSVSAMIGSSRVWQKRCGDLRV